AGLAAGGLVHQAFVGIELLLARSEYEHRAAIAAADLLIGKSQGTGTPTFRTMRDYISMVSDAARAGAVGAGWERRWIGGVCCYAVGMTASAKRSSWRGSSSSGQMNMRWRPAAA